MTNRHRGDYFERQVRDALHAEGPWIVVRSAGSFGIADLVALTAGRKPWLISCKLNGYIGPKERAELLHAQWVAEALALVAMRPKPGWVEFRTVHQTPGFTVHCTMKVPKR
jgi:Holliday junction resolvase